MPDKFPGHQMKQTGFENAFRQKSMLKAELLDVFRIADTDGSGAIDSKEWKAFQNIFVVEFQQCDGDSSWRIDAKEGPPCQVEQKWWKDLNVSGDNSPEMASQAPHQGSDSKSSSFMDMIQAMDRNHDGQLNFAEYLFMRKMASAWRRCVTGWGMNWKELKCGLRVTATVRGSSVNDGDARAIAMQAMTWMELGSKRISIPVFARIAQQQNIFQAYCFPVFDCRVGKLELMRNIELQTVPNALTPLQASYADVFQKAFAVDTLSFDQFMTMMQWIDKYVAQAGVDAMLDVDEFVTILNDRTFNWKLRTTIDYSAVQGKAENELNDSLYPVVSGPPGKNKAVEVRKDVPLTEGDFFATSSNFLQNSEVVEQKGINAEKVKADDAPKARKVLFNVLDLNMDGHLTLTEFFDMIKYQNVFNQMAGNAYKQNPWSIFQNDWKTNNLAVEKGAIAGFPSDSQKAIFKSLEQMTLQQEVNFKEFMILFTFGPALRLHEVPNVMSAVSLVDLMTYLKRADLRVKNVKSFMGYTFVQAPGGNTAYNQAKAIPWALYMEQTAMKKLSDKVSKKEFELDIKDFEKEDAYLGGKAEEKEKQDEEARANGASAERR